MRTPPSRTGETPPRGRGGFVRRPAQITALVATLGLGGLGAGVITGPSSAETEGATLGAPQTLTVPAISMVSRATPGCPAPPSEGCETRPGTVGPGPGAPFRDTVLMNAQGSLYASLTLPAGSRIERIAIRGWDDDDSIAAPTASLVAVRPGRTEVIVGSATLEGSRSGMRTGVSAVLARNQRVLRRGFGYYLRLSIPPATTGTFAIQWVRVSYRPPAS